MTEIHFSILYKLGCILSSSFWFYSIFNIWIIFFWEQAFREQQEISVRRQEALEQMERNARQGGGGLKVFLFDSIQFNSPLVAITVRFKMSPYTTVQYFGICRRCIFQFRFQGLYCFVSYWTCTDTLHCAYPYTIDNNAYSGKPGKWADRVTYSYVRRSWTILFEANATGDILLVPLAFLRRDMRALTPFCTVLSASFSLLDQRICCVLAISSAFVSGAVCRSLVLSSPLLSSRWLACTPPIIFISYCSDLFVLTHPIVL